MVAVSFIIKGGYLKMNDTLFNFQENLENISLQLSNLYSAVDTMSVAFQQQEIGTDVIGCLETICLAVTSIKYSMDKQIEKLAEINKEYII